MVSPAVATKDFADTVRLQCIRRRDPPLDVLAEKSGVSLARLRKLLSNDPETVRTPRLDEALSVFAVLGAGAATGSLARIGMTAQEADAAPPSLGSLVAELIDSAAPIARCAADGNVDRGEADAVLAAASAGIEALEGVRTIACAAKDRR